MRNILYQIREDVEIQIINLENQATKFQIGTIFFHKRC